MLTAEGIVGKLVGFIVNKSIGRLIDLPFDKKEDLSVPDQAVLLC